MFTCPRRCCCIFSANWVLRCWWAHDIMYIIIITRTSLSWHCFVTVELESFTRTHISMVKSGHAHFCWTFLQPSVFMSSEVSKWYFSVLCWTIRQSDDKPREDKSNSMEWLQVIFLQDVPFWEFMYLVCINLNTSWELTQVIQISKTLFIAASFGIDAMSARCYVFPLFVFHLSFSRWYKNGV